MNKIIRTTSIQNNNFFYKIKRSVFNHLKIYQEHPFDGTECNMIKNANNRKLLFYLKHQNCNIKKKQCIEFFSSLYNEWSTKKILVDDRRDRVIVKYSLTSLLKTNQFSDTYIAVNWNCNGWCHIMIAIQGTECWNFLLEDFLPHFLTIYVSNQSCVSWGYIGCSNVPSNVLIKHNNEL